MLRELWPVYGPGLFHFIRQQDKQGCDTLAPGAATMHKGIVAANGCRPESALLLLFGLKRLWPELLHAERADAAVYDLVFTARADVVWLYPLAALPRLFAAVGTAVSLTQTGGGGSG